VQAKDHFPIRKSRKQEWPASMLMRGENMMNFIYNIYRLQAILRIAFFVFERNLLIFMPKIQKMVICDVIFIYLCAII